MHTADTEARRGESQPQGILEARAEPGYILDLSDRFPKSEQNKFLEAPMDAGTWEGKPYTVPWYSR